METFKPYLGGIAVCLGLMAYFLYISSILKNKTKPHAFSWLLWTLTTAIVFAAQIMKGAGPGSWATGITVVACATIGIIALFKYDKTYSTYDILFIGIALVALLPWFFTKNPTSSVILIAVIDVLGYFPTLRKSYYYPHEENAPTFVLNAVKHLFAFLAIQNYVVANWIYPTSQVFMNVLVLVLVLVRRKQFA